MPIQESGLPNGSLLPMPKVFLGFPDAQIVNTLIIGHHFAVAVEHPFDNFRRLLFAVDDSSETECGQSCR